jgi:hypothetical protein
MPALRDPDLPEDDVDAFPHLALFSQRDWGLIIYDEVHLLPAPVFQATASLQARRRLTAEVGDEVTWLTTAPGTLAFRRGDGFVCMVNCGSRAARVPAEAGELVLSSGPVGAAGTLPPDTAAWFLPA